jgi:hypothetical protein
MGEEGTSPPLLRVKEEYHYHPGCPGCAYGRRKDRLRGMPYREFLYVWMISLTAGTRFSYYQHPLSGRFEMAFLLLTVASTCD